MPLAVLWIGGTLASLGLFTFAADRSTTLVKWVIVGGVVYYLVTR